MKSTYQVKVWQEDEWWLARVVAASDGADSAPLNAITQARSLGKIESMSVDLIATVLDADEDAFDIELDYLLPDDASDLVCQAKGARAWLDAAQDLWQERSTAAARVLSSKGYSLRETAILLGLSHQRIDQLLEDQNAYGRSNYWVFQCKSEVTSDTWQSAAEPHDVSALLVIHQNLAAQRSADGPDVQSPLEARFKEFVQNAASWVHRNTVSDLDGADEVRTEHGRVSLG